MFHDLFGTLSTGESGFVNLTALMDGIRPFSDTNGTIKQQLFDIWLLNVADIIVSINYLGYPKYEYAEWLYRDEKYVHKDIKKFFSDDRKGKILIHDYNVASELIEYIKNRNHSDDISQLENKAYAHSRSHTVERIKRLVLETISASQNAVQKEVDRTVENPDEESNKVNAQNFFEEVKAYSDNTDNKTIEQIIIKSIKNHCDFQWFCNSFSLVGQMDYALGFFNQITKIALLDVIREIKPANDTKNNITHWIRPVTCPPLKGDSQDAEKELWKIQARFFIQNQTSIFIQILTHVLHREKSFESFRNLEFGDASERLTEDKIRSIIYLKGPAWSKRATRSILQCIFYW